ncbi:MAG TPA: class I SAM-dependent methyltransferase [Burkholderiales bacterium]|nr:class I SAM-dependent methyltransferase [Burkholderiales bacterium]
MHAPDTDAGSFRDPSGSVFLAGGRIFRTIMPSAAEDHDHVRRTGVLDELTSLGWVIPEWRVDNADVASIAGASSYVVEHPRLPFISYPYEWGFHALKDAALLHLDVHLHCVDRDVTLSDASAYNVQFRGPAPVFIDTLSFRPYREGDIWMGHRQFCDQFLNPLLLRALLGIPHNAWYRGSLEGIPLQHLASVLPFRRKLSWNVSKHVVLQAALEKLSVKHQAGEAVKMVHLPRKSFRAMLAGMRKWVSGLEIPKHEATVWRHYADANSYQDDEARKKAEFVREFASETRPAMLWDLGCNTGEYSRIALDAGARLAIGFDFDIGAVDAAYMRAKTKRLNLLPLHLDITNPSPNQGWAQHERKGLSERGPADAVLALALVHHLAIAKNIPLHYVVDWLVGLAKAGVIEFIPKSDTMVQQLLRLREDIFPDYSEDDFKRALSARARIKKMAQVSATGRTLFWFERH